MLGWHGPQPSGGASIRVGRSDTGGLVDCGEGGEQLWWAGAQQVLRVGYEGVEAGAVGGVGRYLGRDTITWHTCL